MALNRTVPRRRRRSGRGLHRSLLGFACVAALLALLFILTTSSQPAIPPVPAPGPEQAGAGRAAVLQLKPAMTFSETGAPVRFTRHHLSGISALASHGLRPDRFRVSLHGRELVAEVSHHLPGGRWLNMHASFSGKSSGFPSPRLSLGSLTLPRWLGRYPFVLGRWLLRLRGVDVPPLDEMVRSVGVEPDAVIAVLHLPRKTGLVDNLVGAGSASIDPQAVVKAYCSLVSQQRKEPAGDFGTQVRRAFAAGGVGSPAANGVALVALGMLVGDERAGYLVGLQPDQLNGCRAPHPDVTLHGRADLPKHWALSAAIAASQGTQLARAVGEWKELADSLAPKSSFAIGDPSGFSFVDLAADRAGFHAAGEAMSADLAGITAARLAKAEDTQLLPAVLLREPEGLTTRDFEHRFKRVDARRYKAELAAIDEVLSKRWASTDDGTAVTNDAPHR